MNFQSPLFLIKGAFRISKVHFLWKLPSDTVIQVAMFISNCRVLHKSVYVHSSTQVCHPFVRLSVRPFICVSQKINFAQSKNVTNKITMGSPPTPCEIPGSFR